MPPYRLVELELSLLKVIKNLLITCEGQRDFAGVLLHSTKQVVCQHADSILINLEAVAHTFVEDFGGEKLQSLEIIEETLSFLLEHDGFVHRL